MVRAFTLGLALLVTVCSVVVSAADIATFRVGQAVAKHPEITVYVDALDQAGAPVDALLPSQLTATLGQNQVGVKEVKRFDQSGEGIGYIFLIDISRSLTSAQFEQMKVAITLWVDRMRANDRAAVASFGEKVSVIQDFTADKNALQNALKTLTVSDNKTQLHQAIAKGLELGHRTDAALPARRAIIILSDGEDDFPGGMTRDEVVSTMKEDRIPLYAIGFSPRGHRGDVNLKKLGEFARLSGGEFYEGTRSDLTKLYDSIQQKILRSFLVKLDAEKAPADGKSSRLQATLTSGGKSMSDGLDLRIMSRAATLPPPWYRKIPVWGYAVAGGVFLIIVILLVRTTLKRRTRRAEERIRAAQAVKQQEKADQESAIKRAAEEAARQAVAAKQKQDDDSCTVKQSEPSGIRIKLTVVGGGSHRDYGVSLSSRAVIGRSVECDVTIPGDEEISKRQCELTLAGECVLVSDLNSTNGTCVNGVPIRSGHRLKSGNLLLLGRTELRIAF